MSQATTPIGGSGNQSGGTSSSTGGDQYAPDEELVAQCYPVREPSDAHELENIVKLCCEVSHHGHGFSFLPKVTMREHTRQINEFLLAARSKKPLGQFNVRMTTVETIWGAMVNPFGRSATYKGKKRHEGDGYYIVFALGVSGGKYVCYSTHEIPTNTQLFPVAGDISGLLQGRGPIDMALVLDSLGRLDRNLKIDLCLEYRQHWQCLDESNLMMFRGSSPSTQQSMTTISPSLLEQDEPKEKEKELKEKELEVTSSSSTKVVVPKGGWATNKRGTKARGQRETRGDDALVQQMNELMEERRRNPTFTTNAFFGLD